MDVISASGYQKIKNNGILKTARHIPESAQD